MDQSKVDMFIAVNGKKFNTFQISEIKNILETCSEDKFQMALAADYKDPTTMLIISVLAGPLGIDRFMLGETGLGVAKLLTGGGCGIWTIIDWFLIQDKAKEYNFNLFMQMIAI